jgi:hypothetical protein
MKIENFFTALLLVIPCLIFGQVNTTSSGTSTSYGKEAGRSGDYNAFYGYQSGLNNKSELNTFIGANTGTSNITGRRNTFLGYGAGFYNFDGSENIFIGNQSGFKNRKGYGNVFMGSNSGNKNVSGTNNTYLGHYSGSQSTGSNNVFLGSSAGSGSTGSNNMFLGKSAGSGELGSNRLYIDNSSTAIPLIYGKFDSNQVGINTNNIPTGFTFAVKGKVITEEIKVALQGTPVVWPDYVFNNTYDLPSLIQVEKHIKEKGHLKDIPSAKNVKEEGIFLGEMNAKLLRKIEELTLYTIQQQKELELQKKLNKVLEVRLDKIEELIKKID